MGGDNSVPDAFVVRMAIADIRDAIVRIREVLPANVEAFLRDRSAREIVVRPSSACRPAEWRDSAGPGSGTGERAEYLQRLAVVRERAVDLRALRPAIALHP
jgi:hypothetical protein